MTVKHWAGTVRTPGMALGTLCEPGQDARGNIVAAQEFTLAQALAVEGAAGIVTGHTPPGSHVAAVLSALGVPWLDGLCVSPGGYGHAAVLDALSGRLTLDPDETCVQNAHAAARALAGGLASLRERACRVRPSAPDGAPVKVLATLNDLSQASAALAGGAEGVGLLRSEFLCGPEAIPSEDAQTWAYRSLPGPWPVVRLLDAAGDKPLPGCPPVRGIRLLACRPDLLRTQMRALLRASAEKPLRICYPFVTSPQELRDARQLLETCREALTREGVPTGRLEPGAMLETPAAVLTLRSLAEEASFFCLGSGDLTQHTLGVDRGDAGGLYDPRHPAVLRLTALAARDARRLGKDLCVCGPLAEDVGMARRLTALGVRALSVSAPLVPHVRLALG